MIAPHRTAPDRYRTTDGGRVVVPVSDRDRLRSELERFGGETFVERADGSLACDFAGVTQLTVLPDGRVDAGMPLHAFEGQPDRLVFDHERGEVTIEMDRDEDSVSYTFRRP
jgi:bifunctional DNA-binding transcriptional regulator/antitoxin component of YhaV-PrlF toxin-antitoxin module